MCKVNEISKSQHLSMALEAAKMVIGEWDLLTNCVVWSSSEEELFGFPRGTFPETYESAMARIYPNDLDSVTLCLNQARVEQRDYHQELRILGSDGSIHWIEAKGRFFYNDEGQAVRMLATVMEISDRKAREQQLRLLASVVMYTNDSVLITEAEPTDPTDSRIVYANPAFTRMTGYTLEEVLGKTPYILVGEKTDPAAVDKIRTARQNCQPVQVELIHATKDGRDLWIELNIFPVVDETGRLSHWVSVARDITERKQTEAALRESEERFRQIAENIEDVFWISDPIKREILYVSPAYEKIWGRKRESLYTSWNDWDHNIHPDEKERVLETLRERAQQGLFEHEYRIVRPDGTVRWIRDRGFPVKDEFGQLQRITGIAQDITERKLVKLALAESEERFRQIAENIEDVLWILDPLNRQILYISPVYEKIWGRKCESLYATRMDWINSIHLDDRERVQATLGEELHTELFEHEYRIVRPDGTVRWIRDRGFPLKDEFGQILRITGIAQDITQQKLAEVALRESEERFRQLAENIEDVFWISDPTKPQLLYISPAYERIWGRSIESLYASNINLINSTHPDDRERVLATFVETALQGKFEHEYRIVRPDGTVRWIRDRGFPVKDELGQVKYITGIAQDITERKVAEAALQQLNDELEIRVKQRTLELEGSQLILQQQLRREQLIIRLTQQIRQSLELKTILNTVVTQVQKLLASDRVLVYQIQSDGTGRTVAEAVVGDWTRILHQTFPEEAFPEESRQHYLQGRIYALSDRDNGEILPCLAEFLAELQVRAKLVVPIIQQDSLWGLLIIHQCSQPREWQSWEVDLLKQLSSQVAIAIQQSELYQQLKEELRDRQRVEVALRQSETQFRSLSESAPIGIFRADAQGKNIYINRWYQAICGYTFEEALADGWMQFVHPEDLQVILPQWLASAPKQKFSCEIRQLRRDGSIRLCRVRTVPLFCDSGELMGYVGILEDITESRAIEKMKKEFVSIVSHELRTPLTAIRGSLGLLASGVLKDQSDTAKQMLEIAANDTERLVRLVNDILDLERLEANKVFLVKQWCDAATLMRQSVESVQFLASENNITLSVMPCSVEVWADSDRMIQTLVNLLSNAIKFSPPQTTVTLSVEALPDHVLFKVQDQGRGIPHDQLETIFTRFQQVDASDSRQKGGTGLGLAICRGIVQQHGGRIWADSVLGLGSVFYFTLPQPLESEG